MRTNFLKLITSAVYSQPEYSEGFVLVITPGEGYSKEPSHEAYILFLQKSMRDNETNVCSRRPL